MTLEHVLLGFSGGMDSFGAAILLLEKGYRVTAIHFVLHDIESPQVRQHLDSLAKNLNIPLEIIDMRHLFRNTVIEPFAQSYLTGKTPNPCVWCNEEIKCQGLMALLPKYKARWFATGHYANKVFHPETRRWLITRGKDRIKEQSYFLAFVSQKYLQKLLLPLGDTRKEELRERLQAMDAPVTIRDESHDICFLKGESYREFLTTHLPSGFRGEGMFIDAEGHILGKHRGFFHYTVGQRRGIGIADKTPYYVTALFPEKNQVQIGKVAGLYKSTFTVSDCRWHLPPEDETLSALCQIRYRHTAAPAILRVQGPYSVEVTFETPQRAITPGQIAAFYLDDRLIGAGIIEEVLS